MSWWWSAIQEMLGTDAGSILSRCVESRTPAVLLVYNPRRVVEVRFRALREDAVGTELFELEAGELPTGALCSVSFNLSGRAGVFLTTIQGVEHETGRRPFLTLAMPREISMIDARTSYRVPVTEDAGFTVHVSLDGHSIRADAVDLSAGGAKLHMDPLPRDIDVGRRVWLKAKTDTAGFDAEGFVVRIEGNHIGVAFSNVDNGTQLDAVLGELETRWIEKRRAE